MSSQLSFRTALEMQSSPLSEVPSEVSTVNPIEPETRYRPGKELPYELRQHCLVFFEEKLYMQALTLLLNSIISSPPSPIAPTFCPSSQHLSLASTLAVHPSLTTRASDPQRRRASILSLKLLRTTNRILGPVNVGLNVALTFAPTGNDRREASRRRRQADGEGSPEKDDLDSINSDMTTTGSLYSRAEDFWHVLGWAFNCSVLHSARWAVWKPWMEAMLEILEDDWEERKRLATLSIDSDRFEDESTPEVLASSLIATYLPSAQSRHGGYRRVVRAIFADGSPASVSVFKEVFVNETLSLKKSTAAMDLKRKRAVNIEEDIYGDYLDDEDVLDDPAASSLPPSSSPCAETPIAEPDGLGGDERLGGIESLLLRQRFLALIAAVSYVLPSVTTSHSSLYDLYLPSLRSLPLPTFSLLLSPSLLANLPLNPYLALIQTLILSFLSSKAPQSPFSRGDEELHQKMVEECYLRFPANTSNVVDNAKLALLLEWLLRLIRSEARLKFRGPLEVAVEEGIWVREQRAEKDRRGRRIGGKKGREGDEAERWLRASHERMRMLVEEVPWEEEDEDGE